MSVEIEVTDQIGVSEQEFIAFAQAVNATENNTPESQIVEYSIDEPRVKVAYDSRKEVPVIDVSPSDPDGFWSCHLNGPASQWGIEQTVDGGNLLTTLFYQPKYSDPVGELNIWGPAAKSTPEGIEIEDAAGNVDPEAKQLIDR